MPSIVIIDDDYNANILVDHLTFRGYDAVRIGSAALALRAIDTIAKADLIVLDIIMERPSATIQSSISGDLTTGMMVLRAIRQKRSDVPILVYSATTDKELIATISDTPFTTFQSRWNTPSIQDFIKNIQTMLGEPIQTKQPNSFIVHGHDTTEKLALKNYLQNTIGLPEPKILHELPSMGKTIIEKLEGYASETDLAFVLLTPDDKIAPETSSDDDKRRARQNVIFELGYFLGVFGRLSGRVFLLHKGPLDLPSDLLGIVYIDISAGIDAAGETIRKEITYALSR